MSDTTRKTTSEAARENTETTTTTAPVVTSHSAGDVEMTDKPEKDEASTSVSSHDDSSSESESESESERDNPSAKPMGPRAARPAAARRNETPELRIARGAYNAAKRQCRLLQKQIAAYRSADPEEFKSIIKKEELTALIEKGEAELAIAIQERQKKYQAMYPLIAHQLSARRQELQKKIRSDAQTYHEYRNKRNAARRIKRHADIALTRAKTKEEQQKRRDRLKANPDLYRQVRKAANAKRATHPQLTEIRASRNAKEANTRRLAKLAIQMGLGGPADGSATSPSCAGSATLRVEGRSAATAHGGSTPIASTAMDRKPTPTSTFTTHTNAASAASRSTPAAASAPSTTRPITTRTTSQSVPTTGASAGSSRGLPPRPPKRVREDAAPTAKEGPVAKIQRTQAQGGGIPSPQTAGSSMPLSAAVDDRSAPKPLTAGSLRPVGGAPKPSAKLALPPKPSAKAESPAPAVVAGASAAAAPLGEGVLSKTSQRLEDVLSDALSKAVNEAMAQGQTIILQALTSAALAATTAARTVPTPTPIASPSSLLPTTRTEDSAAPPALESTPPPAPPLTTGLFFMNPGSQPKTNGSEPSDSTTKHRMTIG
jgi:hypothetical protein